MVKKTENVRLDKWLWAARFFKTRSLAAKAVSRGKVQVNGQRAKAARNVVIDDQLHITRDLTEFDITVLALATARRPASEARLLYEESEESIQSREEQRDLRRMANAGYKAPAGKPSKRDRRKIKSFTRRDEQE